MIAFIFEVWPADGRVNDYDQPSRAGFDRRHQIKPVLRIPQ